MSDLKLTAIREGQSRGLDATLELDATPEEVWRALTEAEELMRWFPFQATSRPGLGGSIGYSWDGAWESEVQIEAWEPSRHLRTTWPWAPEDQAPDSASPVVVDYYLEALSGGRTRLRLVHTGFPLGDGWDGIFDGTRRGWSFELRSLGHYLGHHRGKERRMLRAGRPMARLSEQEVWRRFWEITGLVASGGAGSDESGRSYTLELGRGLTFGGKILVAIPPTDLGATVEELDRSLLRVSIGHECGPDAPREVQLWLASWGSLGERAETIRAALEALLDRLVAADEAKKSA